MDQKRFEQLKSKYQPVLDAIAQNHVQVLNLHEQDGKLVLRGRAKTHADSNKVWDTIKRVDANYASDLAAELTWEIEGPSAPTSAAAPAHAEQSYAVQAGDTLSKIAKRFYGEAQAYRTIFEANRDQLSDPDKIRTGQVLKIPPREGNA